MLAFVLDLLTISSLSSFGAPVALSVVNLAVIEHYYFDRKVREARRPIHNLVVPAIGFALFVWLGTSLSGLSRGFSRLGRELALPTLPIGLAVSAGRHGSRI
ncbi:hypothetical protein [Paenarthrobacter sp. NPDC090522]|uniref:hypothetical protein n=1 Tax=Paenarthrobacter sp. NPDC090522 TaxID=3364383 RepID=UPI003823F747